MSNNSNTISSSTTNKKKRQADLMNMSKIDDNNQISYIKVNKKLIKILKNYFKEAPKQPINDQSKSSYHYSSFDSSSAMDASPTSSERSDQVRGFGGNSTAAIGNKHNQSNDHCNNTTSYLCSSSSSLSSSSSMVPVFA